MNVSAHTEIAVRATPIHKEAVIMTEEIAENTEEAENAILVVFAIYSVVATK